MIQRTVKLIIALSMLLAVFTIQAECAPSQIGSPCAYGGIASTGQQEPGISLGAGNPIHLVTGNKYQQDTDLPPNPTAPGLELIRHYNALDVRQSVLGRGWVLSYDTRLHRSKTGWQIVQADGARVDFPGSSIQPDGTHKTRHGQLHHLDKHHQWRWPSGTSLRFDQHGYLVAIQWPSREGVTIIRHDADGPLHGAIQAVRNDRGQSLQLHYTVAGKTAQLNAVDTPLGRFSYDYDPESRLVRVSRPDTLQRRYLYEPERQNGHPYALTGIELVSPASGQRQRTNTWLYDAHGRAVQSISGGPHSTRHRLQIDYQKTPTTTHDGLTVVTNEDQQETTFQTALRGGRYALTSVQGAGCFGCAVAGTRASYDPGGRLASINGTRIERTPDGAIAALHPAQSGWPGLTIRYNADGLRNAWSSFATGTEHMHYNAQGLPVERRFANGDSTTLHYDIQHRPVVIHEKHNTSRTTTRLQWNGHWLTRIEHPTETETRHYDEWGRVSKRKITRPTTDAGEPLTFSEQFRYDDQHRMTLHQLPEGGSLHYHWGQGSQLTAIYWQDVDGHKHTVIDSLPGQPGYRYGNGLHLESAAGPDHLIRQLRLHYQGHPLWTQELSYDSQQRIATESIYAAPETKASPTSDWAHTAYAYDDQSRLSGYRQGSATSWLAWQTNGSAAAIRENGRTTRLDARRDASGLVLHAEGLDLSYDANRRLKTVQQDGTALVHYQHNAFGYRISRTNAKGRRTDYFYLNNQLVAQADQPADTSDSANPLHNTASGAQPQNTLPFRITRRYVYAHHVPVAMIDYSDLAPAGQHYAVHADLQGAPRRVTDQERRSRWQADYSPLGRAVNIRGDLEMNLRLPGQVADPDTGWHDNLLRTYLPQWGHYLEPDPLGPLPGNQAYGYANQQPRRYVDPMGLLLFAFDGTRQSADTQSNVWKMSQYYLDGPAHYHPGPGNSVFINWDAVSAHQAKQIIDTQWKWLLHELSRPQAVNSMTPIDILGFSRGAALARHFGNMIAEHVHQGLFRFTDPVYGSISACVDLRFMGLFDTVAQFGIAGSQNRNYDLSIAAAWEWVAHAVALHERRWLFPLTSASSDLVHNVVEAPFIGAHSDIGGGVLPATQGEPGGRGDLSDVALNWMVWQARAASVPIDGLSSEHATITQPILHDFRPSALRAVQDGDRSVDTSSGQHWLDYQDNHPRLGRKARTQTERLIQRPPNWHSQASVEAGVVDMDGYAQWLHDELGWHALPS